MTENKFFYSEKLLSLLKDFDKYEIDYSDPKNVLIPKVFTDQIKKTAKGVSFNNNVEIQEFNNDLPMKIKTEEEILEDENNFQLENSRNTFFKGSGNFDDAKLVTDVLFSDFV